MYCQTIGQITLYVIYGLIIIGQKTKIYHKFPVLRGQLHAVKGNVSLKNSIMNNNNNKFKCQLSAPLERKNSNAII